LVSYPSFVRISNGNIDGVDNLPIMSFYLKIRGDLADSDYNEILNEVQVIISNKPNTPARIWDYRDATSRALLGIQIAFYFFSFAIFLAMVICFFSLLSSMYSNIVEQTKEIGMLLALGTKKRWIYRIYIYEAFIVVFASSIFGALIGTVVAWTMTLQQAILLQFSVPFLFPYKLIGVVFAISVLFSVLSSFSPIRKLLKNEVVKLLTR